LNAQAVCNHGIHKDVLFIFSSLSCAIFRRAVVALQVLRWQYCSRCFCELWRFKHGAPAGGYPAQPVQQHGHAAATRTGHMAWQAATFAN